MNAATGGPTHPGRPIDPGRRGRGPTLARAIVATLVVGGYMAARVRLRSWRRWVPAPGHPDHDRLPGAGRPTTAPGALAARRATHRVHAAIARRDRRRRDRPSHRGRRRCPSRQRGPGRVRARRHVRRRGRRLRDASHGPRRRALHDPGHRDHQRRPGGHHGHLPHYLGRIQREPRDRGRRCHDRRRDLPARGLRPGRSLLPGAPRPLSPRCHTRTGSRQRHSTDPPCGGSGISR